MRLYIVRHGETEYNKTRMIQPEDSKLNEEGLDQAKKISQRLKDIKFDIIYTSPMERAHRTMREIAINHSQTKIMVSELLSETHTGELLGLSYNQARDIRHKHGFMEYKPKGGESLQDTFDRVEKFYKELLKNHEKDTVLIVTHGWPIIKILHCIIGGDYNREFYDKHCHDNTGLSIIDIKSKSRKVHALNSTEHL